MNNKTDIDVRYVSPLKKICMTIGELPSSYLETMSYYEMLVWFTEFLKNQVIPTVNNNAEAVQELQSLYEELRTYVNDYFDNLDVQDEINNKLDEMIANGTMQTILERITISSIKISNLTEIETDTDKFIEAITNYDYIDIDEDIEITLTSPISLDHSINIYGDKSLTINSELPFLIKVTKDNIGIDVHDLTMITNYTGFLFAGGDSTTDGYMSNSLKYFKFNNVDLTGTGQICCFHTAYNENNIYDLDYIEIKNNNVHNFSYEDVTDTAYIPGNTDNHQANGIFIVENMNCNNAVIENNNIKNCEMQFALIRDRGMSNHINNILINNNSMINDDTCFGDNTQFHLYYYFVFAEGKKVTYTNNYVEGLKCKTYTAGGYGTTVGDIYVKADDFISQNNTTKNTRQFYNNGIIAQASEPDVRHWIFKNKSCKNIMVENNTIIEEKDWIEDICDADNTLTYSEVLGHYNVIVDCDSTSSHDYWTIKNNTIDVPNLMFEEEQITTEECYTFSNNTINCENIYGYIFSNGDFNSHFSSFICDGNVINATTNNSNIFKITHGASTSNPVKISPRTIEVSIKNNIFNVPNLYSNQTTFNQTTTSQYLKATNLYIENNTFYRNILFYNISLNDKIIVRNNEIIEKNYPINRINLNSNLPDNLTSTFYDHESIVYDFQTTALSASDVYNKTFPVDNWNMTLGCKLYEDTGNIIEFEKEIKTTYDEGTSTFTVNGSTMNANSNKNWTKTENDMAIKFNIYRPSAGTSIQVAITLTSSTYPTRVEMFMRNSKYSV